LATTSWWEIGAAIPKEISWSSKKSISHSQKWCLTKHMGLIRTTHITSSHTNMML
jgi:hypothetical protein